MLDVCWTSVGRLNRIPACIWRAPGPQTYYLLPSGARSAPKPFPCLRLADSRPANLLPATIWRAVGARTIALLASGAPQARKPIPCYRLVHARRRSRCPACVWAGTGGRVGSGAYRHIQLPFNSQSTPIQPPFNSHSTRAPFT